MATVLPLNVLSRTLAFVPRAMLTEIVSLEVKWSEAILIVELLLPEKSTAVPAYPTTEFSKQIEAVVDLEIPPQSPALGESIPVVPPTLLSLIDVKVIGLVAVPAATRLPWTFKVVAGTSNCELGVSRLTLCKGAMKSALA